jgi:hypothetical protein
MTGGACRGWRRWFPMTRLMLMPLGLFECAAASTSRSFRAPSTHSISNRSAALRRREIGVDGYRFGDAFPSADLEKRRTYLSSLPIARESSVPFQARGGAKIPVGLRRPNRSSDGTRIVRPLRRVTQLGARIPTARVDGTSTPSPSSAKAAWRPGNRHALLHRLPVAIF